MNNKRYWENYYKNHKEPEKHSQFAEFVFPMLSKNSHLLELGCGNGKDSIFLAKQNNVAILAIDQCKDEINYLKNKYGKKYNIVFSCRDFINFKLTIPFNYVYSRFTLHSISLKSEHTLIKNTYNNLFTGGLFFIEARSDKNIFKKGDHYRRFINSYELIKKLENIGFNINYFIEGENLAKYKLENPIIIRIIAEKM